MTVLIEDSPRLNLAGWLVEAADAGLSSGAVVTPFTTPWVRRVGPGIKKCSRDTAERLGDAEVDVWFDAMTHALQMGGVGDFRYYDEYALWGGPRGDLTTSAFREEHVRLVFEVQDELGSPHLGPTILLHHSLSDTSQRALDLACEAVQRDPECWLSIAGTSPFWASGAALDAHVGALAQLEPAGWWVSVVRPVSTLPVEPDVEEVHGLCRTSRALSEYAPVHVSHGDLAALPAVAAGAVTVGSGWDKRQRVCAFSDYSARDPNDSGGSWYQRPTFVGLLGSLMQNEAALLQRQDAPRAARLGGLPAPGPKEAFLHHLGALNDVITRLTNEPDPHSRYRALAGMYSAAAAEWPAVVEVASSPIGAPEWIDLLAEGLGLYGEGEGW